MEVNRMKKCEYIGCQKEATTKTKYETSPGKFIECDVCEEHRGQMIDITITANK